PPTPPIQPPGPPWPDHQAGQPSGPLGRRRGGATPLRRRDRAHPVPADRTPPREDRKGPRRPQAAHPGLLRAARRTRPLPSPTGVSVVPARPGRAVVAGLTP